MMYQDDPYASADEAQPRQPRYWGECQVDASYVILEKGIGKVPFDPQIHPVERRCTAIYISLLVPGDNPFSVERNMIAESSEWTKIVLPSLKALNISLRDLNGRWVCVDVVPTGRTYEKNGEKKDATTVKFVKVFESREEAEIDRRLSFNEAPDTEQDELPMSEEQPPSNGNEKEKAAALQFLRVIVSNAVRGQDDVNAIRDAVATNIPGFPAIAKYFTVDSPETVELIMQEMAK